ncbi:MAG: pentapeptide repeat-containing protein [Spirochaetales bacterium]|nr:pentapeptide repeat-containing protein [Spirochaetales bacterium]
MDKKDSLERFIKEKELVDLDFSRISYADGEIEGKLIDSTIINHARFTNVTFRKSHFDICFMEKCLFEECRFIQVRMTHSLVAGSLFRNCLFEDCDLISVNFNGIEALQTNWIASDLYYSRFISSRLEEVLFDDCNLKRVDFSHSMRQNVSFKSSNVQDAYLDQKKDTP